MNNSIIVIKVNKLESIPNRDKIQLCKLFGTQVIVDINVKVGDILCYGDSNLALSHEFLSKNNLYRDSELNIDKNRTGYFETNRRIRAIKMVGEISDGFLFPASYTSYIKEDIIANVGFEFTELAGHKICEKYIVPVRTPGNGSGKNAGKKSFKAPMFVEHFDTSQFMKNRHKIPAQSIVYLEEKIHGTSHRTGHVKVDVFDDLPWWKRVLTRLLGANSSTAWMYLNGTRRVVHKPNKNRNESYHDNTMREEVLENIKIQKLPKGEQLYIELFGYEKTGKEIQKGFPYGCYSKLNTVKELIKNTNVDNKKKSPYRILLYRVTMNNEDGKVVDYPREYVYNKAEELGFEKPKLFTKFFYSGTKYSMNQLEKTVIKLAQGRSEIGQGAEDTLKEGVVLWFINNKGIWEALKYKSDIFRLKESSNKDKGIIDQEDLN